MKVGRLFVFLFHAVTAGLAAAFVVVLLYPQLLQRNPVVEILSSAPPAPGPVTGEGNVPGSGPASYADAVRAASPSVVNIHTSKLITQHESPLMSDPFFQRFFGDSVLAPRRRIESSLGSGVIVSRQGYVLTNNHVIEGADQIRVMLQDGRASTARIVGTDPETDLAVLRIDLPELPSITIGHAGSLHVGDVVLAIGNPFGVGQTVTMGIVSATGRSDLGINTFEDFIQTDAAINPGNSGGALINPHGALIGINTAIFSRSGGSQGIGFAIPVSLAQTIMEQIIERGHVARGWLGIEVQELTPDLAETFGADDTNGVLVAGVLRGGPGQNAGLLAGDVVTAINGEAVTDTQDAITAIAAIPPGKVAYLQVLREGRTTRVQATVGTRPRIARR